MIRSLLILSVSATLALGACTRSGGDDRVSKPAGATEPEKPGATKGIEGGAEKAVAKAAGKPIAELPADDLVKYGKQLYLAQGGNSCNDCHGVDGIKGRLATAANLTKPSTWKAWKAAGATDASVDERVVAVIEKGAGAWNSAHPDDQYDVQMLGAGQGATKGELRKVTKSLKKSGFALEKKERISWASKAIYAYVKTMSTE